jgi:hypothetical protein
MIIIYCGDDVFPPRKHPSPGTGFLLPFKREGCDEASGFLLPPRWGKAAMRPLVFSFPLDGGRSGRGCCPSPVKGGGYGNLSLAFAEITGDNIRMNCGEAE